MTSHTEQAGELEHLVLLIKPLTIRKQMGPDILSKLLDGTAISLVRFRSWMVCDTTWTALHRLMDWDANRCAWEAKTIRACGTHPSWALRLQGKDIYHGVETLIGPADSRQWRPGHLRHKFSGARHNLADDVFYLGPEEKMDLIEDLLF